MYLICTFDLQLTDNQHKSFSVLGNKAVFGGNRSEINAIETHGNNLQIALKFSLFKQPPF